MGEVVGTRRMAPYLAVALTGAAIGVLLAARRPRNPIGWLLRQSVDFDAVPGELLSAVQHAFQPSHASIWSAGWGVSGPGGDSPTR